MVLSTESKHSVAARAVAQSFRTDTRRSQTRKFGPRAELKRFFNPVLPSLPRTAARSSAGDTRCRPFLLPHPDRFTTRVSERKSGEEVLA